MTTHFESFGEMDVMGGLWTHSTQFQHNDSLTDINLMAQNDPFMCFVGTAGQYLQGSDYGHVEQKPNVGFDPDSTIILDDDILASGRLSSCLLPPENINTATKHMQPQPKTNKPRRQATQHQIKRKPVIHKEEENSFIQSLRTQNVPWKEISKLFFQRFGKSLSNASLQMRMLRRRKRASAWRDSDIKLLHEAYDYWERKKFALIATKLQELGASQTYTERQVTIQLEHTQCERAKDDKE
ncbi:hypothetical protein TCE0_023r07015 [Talaromyces pinophilus]|uniref:Myb-like domain-containing protein n=1 Tax=Talaromyces pinophilus TaxID=128442 RepID=A0A0B8N334_TALPI|nr:hypothetical protein TCE0_023r07015 [Talaromyces pinophilus]